MTILAARASQKHSENQIWRGVVLSSAGRFDVGSVEEKPAQEAIDPKKLAPEFRNKAAFLIRFGTDKYISWEKLEHKLNDIQAWASVYLELVDAKNDFQTVPGSRLAFSYKSQ